MKVKVIAKRGELEERLPDVIRVLQRMAGERLEKAMAEEHTPKDLPLPILDEFTDQASAMGERIRKRMLAKMLEVLK